ncbi:MAG TPA: methyltransferase domain-containing protein [Ktedonobacterales bacterium]|jgi:ubiquinone/menaquinone biosynthesis C-methylase UbiE|nr:methyltransferase domain-containing protein [Ktedonobacterales bacterium]
MRWFRFGRRKNDGVATATRQPTADAMDDRRRLRDAPYVLPSDDKEINRLDFQHYMLRYALRGNFAAPIQRPMSILDVGSGTGRWATEMARLFPEANVIGTDIVAPNPETTPAADDGVRPDNYAFIQGNILEGLPFADGAFDYTHMRLLLFAIPEARWPDVARELVRVTRPGGWIELVETGPQRNGGPAMDQVVNWITQASLKRGINPLLGPSIGGFLSQAGVPNVSAREIALPVGAYGGRVGRLAETDVFGVLQGVKGLVAAQNLATPEQYDNAVMAAKADLNNYQCALPFYIAYGQRPA